MADGQPWGEYHRAKLPGGWTYLLGRDAIEQALRAAGASIRCLLLGRPDLPVRTRAQDVFDVYWYGDSHPGSSSARDARADLLLMRWTAVPSDLAPVIVEDVRQVWLPQGCAWAAEALGRGNTWSAAEHRWRLVHEDGALRAVET